MWTVPNPTRPAMASHRLGADSLRRLGPAQCPCVSETIGVRKGLGRSRNGERKRCARTIIECRPQTAMMALDNRATDGKSDSHTAALSCVERFEQLFHTIRFDAHAHILHGQPRTIVFSFGPNHQPPRTIINVAHCV